jgi:GNAT superfamily N-acetyltransferase
MVPRTQVQLIAERIRAWPEVERFELAETLHSIEITNIRIRPSHRGKGIGKSIFDQLKEYAARHGIALVLSPNPDQGKRTALERFYRKLGFRPNRGRNRRDHLGTTFVMGWYWEPDRKHVNQPRLF